MLRAGRSELPAAAVCAGFCPSLCDKTLHFGTQQPLATHKEAAI